MRYFLLWIVVLAACNNDANIQKNNAVAIPSETGKDTIIHPVNTNAFAQLLLTGKVKVSDNDGTFGCLDSLLSPGAGTRKFYYPVGRIIMNQSDGALSEAIGGYLENYLRRYPAEAIDHYKEMTSEEQQKFIDYIAFEFYANTDSGNNVLNKYKKETILNCVNCSSEKRMDLENIILKIGKSATNMNDQ